MDFDIINDFFSPFDRTVNLDGSAVKIDIMNIISSGRQCLCLLEFKQSNHTRRFFRKCPAYNKYLHLAFFCSNIHWIVSISEYRGDQWKSSLNFRQLSTELKCFSDSSVLYVILAENF